MFRHFACVASAVIVFHASFVLLCINMKRQQKLTFLSKREGPLNPPENDKNGPEKDVERSEESLISISTSHLHEPTASS